MLLGRCALPPCGGHGGLASSVHDASMWADHLKTSQLCKAYRNEGGRTIVILSQQPKLEMEATFRRTIPNNQRFGSSFVFRQVSSA